MSVGKQKRAILGKRPGAKQNLDHPALARSAGSQRRYDLDLLRDLEAVPNRPTGRPLALGLTHRIRWPEAYSPNGLMPDLLVCFQVSSREEHIVSEGKAVFSLKGGKLD